MYALFMVCQKVGPGEAISAKWGSGGNRRARAGGDRHGHGLSFFSTMCEAFWKKYMTFTTMGHMARHPHHYWRRAQQFLRMQSAHGKDCWRRCTLQCTANNTESSPCDAANVHPR